MSVSALTIGDITSAVRDNMRWALTPQTLAYNGRDRSSTPGVVVTTDGVAESLPVVAWSQRCATTMANTAKRATETKRATALNDTKTGGTS